ncbi:hypothetical protein BDQ17DRAFT_1364310 [Cyathus striatus]|nr:hypothetical protein BDQ17DRAFT_1364310 [Cyathus striatus]
MITFYDIHSTTPKIAWSLMTWKVRYILNYKNLPYKAVYVEYPDIEETCKKLGILPTSTKADGSPYYTFPAIYDSSTDKSLADSLPIAQYLDATYPDTPVVIAKGTEVLTLAYLDNFVGKFAPFYICLLRPMAGILSPRSVKYLSPRLFFGRTWADLMALTKEDEREGLKKVNEALVDVDQWFRKAGQEGSFLTGEKPVFVDFAVGGMFVFIRTLVEEESEAWKEIVSWQGGRWAKLLDDLKEWEVIA